MDRNIKTPAFAQSMMRVSMSLSSSFDKDAVDNLLLRFKGQSSVLSILFSLHIFHTFCLLFVYVFRTGQAKKRIPDASLRAIRERGLGIRYVYLKPKFSVSY